MGTHLRAPLDQQGAPAPRSQVSVTATREPRRCELADAPRPTDTKQPGPTARRPTVPTGGDADHGHTPASSQPGWPRESGLRARTGCRAGTEAAAQVPAGRSLSDDAGTNGAHADPAALRWRRHEKQPRATDPNDWAGSRSPGRTGGPAPEPTTTPAPWPRGTTHKQQVGFRRKQRRQGQAARLLPVGHDPAEGPRHAVFSLRACGPSAERPWAVRTCAVQGVGPGSRSREPSPRPAVSCPGGLCSPGTRPPARPQASEGSTGHSGARISGTFIHTHSCPAGTAPTRCRGGGSGPCSRRLLGARKPAVQTLAVTRRNVSLGSRADFCDSRTSP